MTRERLIAALHARHRRHPGLVNALLGAAWPLTSARRLRGVPGVWALALRDRLSPRASRGEFPPVERALRYPNGLVAVGGAMTTPRLVAAYRAGIYPWCHVGPVQWRAPAERMVLFPHETHVTRRFRGYLRNQPFRVTFDRAFGAVVAGCAEPRPDAMPLTWITPRFVEAFARMHAEGHAHSVEVWEGERLAGGLYGVAIGRLFFTESMFSRRPNASKFALVWLNCALERWGYAVNDVKRPSRFWAAQGARPIPRAEFGALVERWRDVPGEPAPWRADESLDVARWVPGGA